MLVAAVLAQRPGEGENRPGQYTLPAARHADAPKDIRIGQAQRFSGPGQRLVKGFKRARAALYMSGKATTTAAKIADHQVMTILNPNTCSTHAPIIRLGPKKRKRRYPTTVGGSTSGSVRITSRTPFISFGVFAM
jgi:hypothetical protein